MATDRGERLLPWAGVLFSVIFAIGFFSSGETPDTTDSAEAILDHYDDAKVFVGAALFALAGAVFMFFAAGLRRHMLATGPEWLGALMFAGSIVLVVGLGIFSSGQFALGSAGDEAAVDTMRALNYIDSNNFPPAIIGLTIFYWAMAWHVLTTKSLPVWIGWLSVLLGILCLGGPLGFIAFLALTPYVLIVSITLIMRGRSATAAV